MVSTIRASRRDALPVSRRPLAARAAWPLVVSAALALSWWSLDSLALSYHFPWYLAAAVSAVYDGATLVGADLALRYVSVADSALSVRALMLGAVGLSTWLNYEHASILGYGAPGRVMFAAPPLLAGFLFALELRFVHREALRASGRVAPALPPVGIHAAVLHPVLAFRRIDEMTAHRIASMPLDLLDWTVPETPVEPEPAAPVAPSEPRRAEDATPVKETQASDGNTACPSALYVPTTDEIENLLRPNAELAAAMMRHAQQQGMSVRDTARWVDRNPGTVSRMFKRLTKSGEKREATPVNGTER